MTSNIKHVDILLLATNDKFLRQSPPHTRAAINSGNISGHTEKLFRVTLLRVSTPETDRNIKLRRDLYPDAARNAPVRKKSYIGIVF